MKSTADQNGTPNGESLPGVPTTEPAPANPVPPATEPIIGTFDPAQEASKIREHLSNRQPVILLVGAGGSAAIDGPDGKPLIPAVAGLTERCRESITALGTWAEVFWARLVGELDASAREPTTPIGVEDILTAVRAKLAGLSEGDTTLGVDLVQLTQIEESIRRTIARLASPPDGSLSIDTPHRALARWIGRATRRGPIEVFTTNYDTLIERALEAERVSYFDGFVGGVRPFFQASTLARASEAPGVDWARVWKVHGSVNWELTTDDDGGVRVTRRESVEDPHLILPSSLKYDQSRKLPYIALLDRFTKALNEPGALLVTIGFSFGDQHINEILREALAREDAPHLFAFQFEDPTPGSAIWSIGAEFANVLVFGPGVAVIGRRQGLWRLVDPVNDATASDLDMVFDSDAVADDEPAVTGRFRLGDFKWLARFLDRISDGA